MLAAYLASDLSRRVDLVVVTGPFLPEEECAWLETTAARYANVKNSALDRRHARPNAPRGRLGEPVRLQHDHGPVGVRRARAGRALSHAPRFEQSTRAAIGGRGLVRTLASDALDEAALGRELAALLDFKPAHRA
ncbi:MAG: hypothetical protein R2838_04000 [Caldilineaceae bacterium]